MNKKTIFSGAIILVVFNLVGKVIGAVYRIPLSRVLGTQGIGIYQLVFPLYALILTISTSGIPFVISKMVAEFNAKGLRRDSNNLLKVAVMILSLISLLFFVFVILCAKIISRAQGNSDAYICYFGLAPAIIFVGVISAFRGYFQGNLLMTPTAISNLLEQIFKLVFGLFLSQKLIKFGVIYSVLGALIAITISEIISFLFLLIYYIFYKAKSGAKLGESTKSCRSLSKKLIRISIPITLSGLVTPLTTMIDSFLVVNILSKSGFSVARATSLLGIEAGVVEPLIHLPIVIAISISMVLLPSISSLLISGENEKISELVSKAFQICLSISFAFLIGYIFFGGEIINFLYGKSFSTEDLLIAKKILYFSSINIIFMSVLQISSVSLQSYGKYGKAVRNLVIGSVIKIVVESSLLFVSSINIFAVIISATICYITIISLNFTQISKLISINYYALGEALVQDTVVCVFAFFFSIIFKHYFSDFIATVMAGSMTVLTFFVSYYIFFLKKNKRKTIKEELLS